MTVLPIMEKALELLQAGKPARIMLKGIAAEDLRILQGLNLLTSHPVLYVCNVAEKDAATGNEHTRAVEKMAEAQGARTVVISAAIEAEVAQLPDDEELEFLASMGLEEPGLDKLIRAGYELLNLITYFTAGPKETRAWTDRQGHQGAAGGRRHPHRLRARLHPRPDDRLQRLRHAWRRSRRQGGRQGARRRQGICRPGRRRHAVQVQHLSDRNEPTPA